LKGRPRIAGGGNTVKAKGEDGAKVGPKPPESFSQGKKNFRNTDLGPIKKKSRNKIPDRNPK